MTCLQIGYRQGMQLNLRWLKPWPSDSKHLVRRVLLVRSRRAKHFLAREQFETNMSQRHEVVFICVRGHSHTDLAKIGRASCLQRFQVRIGYARGDECGENHHDGEDDKQFEKGERVS